MSEDRKLLLQLIASLTLADHMGDVSGDVSTVLKRIGYGDWEWDDWGDLQKRLHGIGVTTLYGTAIGDDGDTERA